MTTSTPCPSDGLTARGRRDGFGAQYSAMVSVFVYAARSNRTYCTTPWRSMQHGLDASRMFVFVGGAAFGPRATDATPVMADAHAVRDVAWAEAFYERLRACELGEAGDDWQPSSAGRRWVGAECLAAWDLLGARREAVIPRRAS